MPWTVALVPGGAITAAYAEKLEIDFLKTFCYGYTLGVVQL